MTPPHPLRRHRTRAVAAASDSLNVISAGNYANANVFMSFSVCPFALHHTNYRGCVEFFQCQA